MIHLNRRRALGLATTGLAATAVLGGCASVPDIDTLIPPRSNEHVDAPPVEDDPLQRYYALQVALQGSPLVTGNQTTLLGSAQQAFASMFAAMAGARDHINLEYFILADVAYQGVRLSDLLLDRLRAGVRVNMIYDSFGSATTPGSFFDRLREGGAKIIAFNPIDPLEARVGWFPNDRDHRKILIVDGNIGFTGGVNLDKVYENPKSAHIPPDGDTSRAFWRDTALRIEGPAVAELQKLFFGTWREQAGPPVYEAGYFPPLARRGVQTIRIIGSSPGNNRPLYYLSIMTAIRSARERIWLSSGYFVPPHQEREALSAAARAGVDVRIVAPSHTDVQAAVYAARADYGDLLEAGAHIFEQQDAVLHSKLAVVDGVWTAIGSSNLDRRSIVFNNEVDAIIVGRDTASQAQAILADDVQAATAIPFDSWRHRPLAERVREWKARLWEYWM